MPRSANRRVRKGQTPRARTAKKGSRGRGGARRSGRGARGRAAPRRRGRAGPEHDEELRARRRGLLVVGALLCVNALVFWRSGDQDTLMPLSAGIGARTSLVGTALPHADTCDGRTTRVFDGLDDQLHRTTRLSGGRTLRLGLLDLGIRPDSIDEAEAAVRTSLDLGILSSRGAQLRVALDRLGAIAALEIELSEGHLVQLCRAGGDLTVRTLQHPLRTDVEVIKLSVPRSGSLFEAVEGIGEHGELARSIGAVLAADVDFSVESQPGDTLTAIVEKRYLGQAFHRYGPVLAIRYKGAMGHKAYYLAAGDGPAPRYFDRKGTPMRRKLLRSPLGVHPFDPERRGSMAPTIEYVDGRIGLVFQRDRGTPVVALGDGTITFAGRHSDEGLVVEVALDERRRVRYAHLDHVMGTLEVGQRVSQGDLVGTVGHSGQARSDRLRVEFLFDGVLVDPSVTVRGEDAWAARDGAALRDEALEQFRSDIRSWRRALIK